MFQWLQPQWFVDVRDAAALHVAALMLEGLEGERAFRWASRIRGRGLLRLWKSRTLGAQLEGKGEDLSELPRERGEELLRKLEGRGWIGFGEPVRANVKSFYPE